jgi:hypothetical protein
MSKNSWGENKKRNKLKKQNNFYIERKMWSVKEKQENKRKMKTYMFFKSTSLSNLEVPKNQPIVELHKFGFASSSKQVPLGCMHFKMTHLKQMFHSLKVHTIMLKW